MQQGAAQQLTEEMDVLTQRSQFALVSDAHDDNAGNLSTG